MSGTSQVGTIAWTDLTVPNAEQVRDFYAAVVGWAPEPVEMGEYNDFNMTAPSSGEPIAGVCHARGGNADNPAQWMLYVIVANLDQSTARCTELGGEVVVEPRHMGGHGKYCVIRDPAGAVIALFEKAA